MNKYSFVIVAALLGISFLTAPGVNAQGVAPSNPKKQTSIGKYVTSAEAYQMWKASPDTFRVLDVRTPEEYAFTGHASAAYNIPSMLWTGQFDASSKDYTFKDNPQFETQVQRLFSLNDTILVMCRSGQRGAAAVNRMAKIGYRNVYNIVDGFEGEKISDENNPNYGKRMLDGWKNASVPWTYDLDPRLIYEPTR